MKVEVYTSESANSFTILPAGSDKKILEHDAILLRTVEGEDWDDCIRKNEQIRVEEWNEPIIKSLIEHYSDITLNYCNRTAVCSQLNHMGFVFTEQPAPRKQLDNAYERIHNEVKNKK